MSEPVHRRGQRRGPHYRKSCPEFYELEPGGPLVLELGSDGWLLEVKPEGRSSVSTGWR